MNEVLDDHTLTKRLQKRVKELELQLAKKEELVCSLMVLMSGSQSKCLVVDVMTSGLAVKVLSVCLYFI